MTPLPSILTAAPPPRLVPNLFPTTPAQFRLAIVGEAPGRDEEAAGEPFVGASGRLLTGLLNNVGISRSQVFLGNVCQIRPPNNNIEAFKRNGPELTSGTEQLRADLLRWTPHLCLCLGNSALRVLCGSDESVTNWRGSLFTSSLLAPGFPVLKCLATYHPAAVLRQYDWAPILRFDLIKAKREAMTPELVLPERRLLVPDEGTSSSAWGAYVVERLTAIAEQKPLVSLDIEGGINTMSCVSFATSANEAFIVPWSTGAGCYYDDPEVELAVWEAVARVLQDPAIPKVLQNSLYDNFVLSYSYKCPILGVRDDTMLKHWELFSELEKSLGFQASLYTNEPYYKYERKAQDLRTFWQYCCKDSAVTYEINTEIEKTLAGQPAAAAHYRFNINLLPTLLYMELRGIKYDYQKALARRAGLLTTIAEKQELLNTEAGHPLNTGSPKQMTKYLYEDLGLPPVLNRKTGRPTANYEAVLSLAKKTGYPALQLILDIRSLSTRARMLQIHPDADGRIRCGYNLVGTETGRLTCYTSPTGSGYNLQTIPEYDRDLFSADDDCWLFQCDLSGADGWTVAAHCYAQGDPTMLDDLRAGVKIAKVIALMFRDGPDSLKGITRDDLKARCDTIAKSDPLYFGSKCCQHGSNYGMGKVLLSATIFTQSEGTVNIPAAQAQRLQDLYFARYPGVLRWHNHVQTQLRAKGFVVSASGHKRILFGRRNDHSTFKAALANEPQENTTYATNLATNRLWTDRRNRRTNGSLIVEPLHSVHDALVGQFPRSATSNAVEQIREWFHNRLVIAGIDLVIPFEGAYGSNWRDLEAGRI